jgi:hypothetical protein
MRRAGALLLAVLALTITAGCGGDDKPAADEPNGIENKSPQEALADAGAALKDVKSFHVEATEGRTTGVVGDVGEDKLRIDVRQRDARARMLLIDKAFYMRGNAAFWRSTESGVDAEKLAGRWLRLPGSAAGLEELAKQLDPENLSRCLLTEHGTLAPGGTAIVDGRPALVIIDAGDKPGTAPGRLYVAATGEPLPLRTIATGSEKPGGKKDPLCDGDSRTRKGDQVALSRYDEGVKITAPPNAVDLSELGGGQPS